MIRFAVGKWDENKENLRNAFREMGAEQREFLSYGELMGLCVKYILNIGTDGFHQYCEDVTEISTGGYQGSILFVIRPKEKYGVGGFLVSCAEYGSCTLCDSLQAVLCNRDEEKVVDGLMALCKDLVCNIKKPYNDGWRYEEEFATIEEDTSAAIGEDVWDTETLQRMVADSMKELLQADEGGETL